MAMHEFHDEDLILDLLEDPAVTPAAVSSRLDECAQCVADYADQRGIIEQLSHLESPTLTAFERSALRSAVFDELASDDQESNVPESDVPASNIVVPLRPRRAWDWTRLGTVAAALVGVVAVAGLVSVLGGTNDQATEGLDTAAVAVNADDAGGASLEAPLAESDAVGADAMEESAGDAAAIAAPSDLVKDIGAVDRPGFAAELEDVRDQVTQMTESSGVLQRAADEVPLACREAVPDLGAIRAIVTAVVDGFEVEVYFDNSGAEFGYASIDCTTYELP